MAAQGQQTAGNNAAAPQQNFELVFEEDIILEESLYSNSQNSEAEKGHGNIKFVKVNTESEPPSGYNKYIYLQEDAKFEDIWKLFTKIWGLYKPNFVICINRMDKYDMDDKLLGALVQAAVKTRAWIVTDGSNQEIFEKIAEAVQNAKLPSKDQKQEGQCLVPWIVFYPWAKVEKAIQLGDKHVGSNIAKFQISSEKLNPFFPLYMFTANNDTTDSNFKNFGDFVSVPTISIHFGAINTLAAVENGRLVSILKDRSQEKKFVQELKENTTNVRVYILSDKDHHEKLSETIIGSLLEEKYAMASTLKTIPPALKALIEEYIFIVEKFSMNGAPNTECLGNIHFPSFYNFMEMPSRNQKFILFSEQTKFEDLWKLLTTHWGLYCPNLVILINSAHNVQIDNKLLDDLVQVSLRTKAWIVTDGSDGGIAERIAHAAQKYARELKLKDPNDRKYIPLLVLAPWSKIERNEQLDGWHLWKDSAAYETELTTATERALHINPYHSVYIFTDKKFDLKTFVDKIREQRQGFFSDTINVDGWSTDKDAKIPTITLTFDEATIEEASQNGKVVTILEDRKKKANLKQLFKGNEKLQKEKFVLFDPTDTRNLKNLEEIIIETLLEEKKNEPIKGFCLTLAFDRPDIAKEKIIDTHRKELHSWKQNHRSDLLYIALLKGRDSFVKLLLDRDGAGKVDDFEQFLTLEKLWSLHWHIFRKGGVHGKLLYGFTKPENEPNKKEQESDDNQANQENGCSQANIKHLMPQMGRVIFFLMGNNYRLLYQDAKYNISKEVNAGELGIGNEEAVWYMLFWSALANERGFAEAFIAHTSCKLGAALVVFKMFNEMSKAAELTGELEHSIILKINATHFEGVAYAIVDRMYNEDRDTGYVNLVMKMPFDLACHMTPLSVAIDAGAQKFMSHACVQTLIDRIWCHYTDPKLSFFWLIPPVAWISFPWFKFDPTNLMYGSYKESLRDEIIYFKNKERLDWERPRGNQVQDTASALSHGSTDIGYRWWSLRMFLTSSRLKFATHLVTYLIFLGCCTYFLLSVLAPISNITETTNLEWFIMLYVTGLALEDLVQLFCPRTSGPLYKRTRSPTLYCSSIWSPWERFKFFIRAYKFSNWLSDPWNKIDGILLLAYFIAVIFRFTLGATKFSLVRLMFVVSLILFYIRFLRFGCISYFIGPRLVTIGRMFADLFKFMLILAVFIVSFGIAFQALLEPNQPPGFTQAISILWRPYWQLYETLYLDDIMDSEGYNIKFQRNCTYHLTGVDEPLCDEWVMPLLIAVYKVVAIIILLNLLIAIFSHSFSMTEDQSVMIWRHQLGALVHEYYYQVWLPSPFNIMCHATNILIWVFSRRKREESDNHLFQHSKYNHEEKEMKKWIRLREKSIEEKLEDMAKANDIMDRKITWIMNNIHLHKSVNINVENVAQCVHKKDIRDIEETEHCQGHCCERIVHQRDNIDSQNVCVHVVNCCTCSLQKGKENKESKPSRNEQSQSLLQTEDTNKENTNQAAEETSGLCIRGTSNGHTQNKRKQKYALRPVQSTKKDGNQTINSNKLDVSSKP